MDVHIRHRATVKSSLTRFSNFLNSYDHAQSTQLEVRLSKVEELFDQFNTIQEAIDGLTEDDNLDAQVREREDFENLYFSIVARAKQLLIPQVAPAAISVEPGLAGVTPIVHKVKLPSLQLMKFSGSREEWMSFRNYFLSVVHSNQALSDVQKLYYLKSALLSDAAEIISTLELSDENYAVAWQLLESRYHNEVLIVNHHVKRLFELRKVRNESAKELRELLNETEKHMRALGALNQPIEHWDILIIHITVSKFDATTFREWQNEIDIDKLPSYNMLLKFLNKRCNVLETISVNTPPTKSKSERPNYCLLAHQQSCKICGNDHNISQCETFLSLSIPDRIKRAKQLGLCINCLKPHKAQCKSIRRCKTCSKRHNSLLHLNEQVSSASKLHIKQHEEEKAAPNPTSTSQADRVQLSSCCMGTTQKQLQPKNVLLATVLIDVIDKGGMSVTCRALLDSGSQVSFMTKGLCNQLGLTKYNYSSSINTLGASKTTAKYIVQTQIKSRTSSFAAQLTFCVLNKIADRQPNMYIDPSLIEIPEQVTLADPTFHTPSAIDVLLGAEVFWDCILPGKLQNSKKAPQLQETRFGWVFTGPFDSGSRLSSCSTFISVIPSNSLETQIRQFWEIENVESHSERKMNPEEEFCERIFDQTTTRDETGRYTVQIPLTEPLSVLGDSKGMALKRFLSLERRLAANPDLSKQYGEFIAEYLKLGHMELVGNFHAKSLHKERAYYIPHHCIFKESTTTKLRVVFDASMKTSSGYSLNDISGVGPVVQSSLFDILVRFRKHKYAFIADAEKMYRQILIDRSQIDLQRILWRFSPNEPLKIYRLLTVTYGTATAPYLATKTLVRLAEDGKHAFPEAAKALIEDFYVDDVSSGHKTLEGAIALQNKLIQLLRAGGFKLRKWTANHHALLNHLPEGSIDIPSAFIRVEGGPDTVKTLGLRWNPVEDMFEFTSLSVELPECLTKRNALSLIAKIFDPLGLIGPIVLTAKILMQGLWKIKLDWDDVLPPDILQQFTPFILSIRKLHTLTVSRWYGFDSDHSVELHGFSDASEKAYGGCVYLRTTDKHGKINVSLLASKSRVAPLHVQTLPRLELCGALLLSELMFTLVKSLKLECTPPQYFYSDSTIVLCWIKSSSARFNTFVANRISKIQQRSKGYSWQHIASHNNPADLISRGTTPEKLISSELWWHGPKFLIQGRSVQPDMTFDLSTVEVLEVKQSNQVSLISQSSTHPFDDIIKRTSSFTKLRRCIAYCTRFVDQFIRFIHRKRNSYGTLTWKQYIRTLAKHKPVPALSVTELNSSQLLILKHAQKQVFVAELECLQKKLPLPQKSRLRQLDPFIGEDALLRVGGRLQKSSLPFQTKHPIILPHGRVSYLIFRRAHFDSVHTGPQSLLNEIRHEYWPIKGKLTAQAVVRGCVACYRANPRPASQIMGQLPKDRVQSTRPFLSCGIDYCGPILVRYSRRKGVKPTKAYVAVFVCMSTKAVHVELVEDMTTAAFLRALRRFISRRGKPTKIRSDNARTFVGANKELKEMVSFIKSEIHQTEITTKMAEQGIEWEFLPAMAPNFGGLWEATIKMVKLHLRKSIGNACLTYFELSTMLCQIEAIINGRPLTKLSDDPYDLEPLTPNHFLIGGTTVSLPMSSNSLGSRWRNRQLIINHFWKRWQNEYLVTLQKRHKWIKPQRSIDINTLVLIKRDIAPVSTWKLGRVVQTHPGPDGHTRVVTLRTQGGTIKLPITKICPLPEDEVSGTESMKARS